MLNAVISWRFLLEAPHLDSRAVLTWPYTNPFTSSFFPFAAKISLPDL